MTPLIETYANRVANETGAIRLSVLIPFLRDDPSALIASLAADAPDGVEILAFDDGAPDAALNAAVRRTVEACALPASLLTAKANLGRSGARNRLAARARGAWLLFLDADMVAAPGFLQRWADMVEASEAAALFGGYTPVETDDPCLALHAALASAGDVKPAEARAKDGAVAVCSSNLAVRADAFAEVRFDENYQGWGWEDVDWALSFAERYGLGHVDNPAGHGGLEPAARLLDKFSRSGSNFARLLARHPGYAARPGAKLALTLKRSGLTAPARLAGRAAALAPLPMRLRVLGAKLYRAAIGAEALL